MTASSPAQPSAREVAELLAWARCLATAGADAEVAEVAAYQATKADLLARITDHTDPHINQHGHGHDHDQEQR